MSEIIMTKARTQLLLDHPFFGVLALKLRMVPRTDIKTAATDGKMLFYNTDFVQRISTPESKGLVAHEVCHPAFFHHTRREGRDPKLWNIACDYAINPLLIKSGLVLPKGALLDRKYEGMSAEQIYNLLPKDAKQCPWGIVLDAQGDNDGGTSASHEQEWKMAVTQAVQTAQQAGQMPGHLKEIFDDILEPVVPWRNVLWSFCFARKREDYTWAKPNRAWIAEDEYLPTLLSTGAGHLAVISDTSGSTAEYYEQFIAEVDDIHKQLKPEQITLIHCDTEVQHSEEIFADDEFSNKTICGGGGTRFSPAFDWIEKNHGSVDAAIYLTDLESNDFGPEPPYPVLWVSTTNEQPPWGQLCRMKF